MKIRKYLTTTALTCKFHSFVTIKLDFSNALIYNIPNCHLQKLQRAQDWEMEVILEGDKYDHFSPI